MTKDVSLPVKALREGLSSRSALPPLYPDWRSSTDCSVCQRKLMRASVIERL